MPTTALGLLATPGTDSLRAVALLCRGFPRASAVKDDELRNQGRTCASLDVDSQSERGFDAAARAGSPARA
jgi:hypothetical protein